MDIVTIIFFVTGLIVGSFLNVVVYRLRLAETILGRSYCPHCKAKIRWYDNVPLLSFILLKARCRDCQSKISWRYPAMEILTGVLFALTAKYFLFPGDISSYWQVGFILVIFSLFLVLTAYDWQYMEMPMSVFWVLLITILVYLFIRTSVDYSLGRDFFQLSLVSGLLGGVVAWIFFFCLVFFSKEKWMGWGDVYVGFLVGLFLGWRYIYIGLLLAFMIGSLQAIIMIVFKRGSMKTQIPFIPFLVIGMIIAFFIAGLFPEMVYMLFF